MSKSRFDLIVIGAGPAGLSAATEAVRHGATVCVLDEQQGPGGQIYRAVKSSPLDTARILGKEYGRGRELVREFDRADLTYVAGATILDVTIDKWMGYQAQDGISYIHGNAIIVATGAQERPFPIEGWTLPGVMTAGAAQILLKSSGVVPSGRTVVAGTGPLLYLLTWQLIQAGRPPDLLLETTPRRNYVEALRHFPGALKAFNQLTKGLGLIKDIRRAGVRHIGSVTEIRAVGNEKVSSVSFVSKGREQTFECELLLLHQGVIPNIQIPQALRCDLVWDDAQFCFRPVVDEWGRTTVDGVYVAGDGAGIGGAVAAEHRGRLAGLDACCHASRLSTDKRDEFARPIRAALQRELAIRPFLDALYQPQHRIPENADTVVCRCEEITAGQITAAVAAGCHGPNQLKAFVRSGMGPCQGRMCGPVVSELIARERGLHPDEIGYYRLRPPIKPMRLRDLAEMKIPTEKETVE